MSKTPSVTTFLSTPSTPSSEASTTTATTSSATVKQHYASLKLPQNKSHNLVENQPQPVATVANTAAMSAATTTTIVNGGVGGKSTAASLKVTPRKQQITHKENK